MALSSGRLVTRIISPLAGKGEADCSKTPSTVHYALGNIARFHFSHLGAWGKMESLFDKYLASSITVDESVNFLSVKYTDADFIAELRWPKAAKRSPIPI